MSAVTPGLEMDDAEWVTGITNAIEKTSDSGKSAMRSSFVSDGPSVLLSL